MRIKCISEKDPHRRTSKEIDKMIGTWMKRYRKSIKLLLLGAGESGKTTILKQMKIIHQNGFSDEEKKVKAFEIRKNLLEAIKVITDTMECLDPPISFWDKSCSESLEFIRRTHATDNQNFVFPREIYHHLKRLWQDHGVQESLSRSDEYDLIDRAKYFFEKIDEVARPDYLPSDSDVLRCRKRTVEIQRMEFEVKIPGKYGGGTQLFWMFDVGGQRGERRKWIQVFDGITAVLFLVASSEFDTNIREDNKTNRLIEALNLFKEVWSSRFLGDSAFILFLNKQDLLREKINSGTKLEKFFPDFENYVLSEDIPSHHPEYNYRRARAFIRDRFLSVTKIPSNDKAELNYELIIRRGRECFWHYTTATDTDNIRNVFNDIHTMIIIWNLKTISIN